MKKIVKEFERLVHVKTAAQVAVWLGYRDTRPIYQWIQRNEIPKARVDAVKALLEKHL